MSERSAILNAADFETYWNILNAVGLNDGLKTVDKALGIDKAEMTNPDDLY